MVKRKNYLKLSMSKRRGREACPISYAIVYASSIKIFRDRKTDVEESGKKGSTES
jgi:hypothetical protein